MSTAQLINRKDDNTNGYCLARCLISPDMFSPALREGWSCTAGVLHCGVGKQRFGGLFEAFFESYWVRFTALRQVEWRARLSGSVRVRLLRRAATGDVEQCLVEWQGDGGKDGIVLILAADLSGNGESSLQIEIDSAESACLSDMGWYVPDVPLNRVRLGLVITTYEREPFVRANLARLAEQLGEAELVIVNHGEPGLAERLADAVPAGLAVRFIDQENSGGAGGFTRGMLEHKRAGRVSHVMLMDDDVDLPADLVPRVEAVLAWADKPLCIGGAMFDYNQRSKLFSAGDFLIPNSFGIGHIVPEDGCNVTESAGVDFLARLHAPEFNGWWCFAFPLAAMDEVGLPMPCFIRGDDVEYGYRLKRAGWPTLGWPGIAVWHMPFADKSAAWHMFYDRRNSLFANVLHRRVGRWRAAGKLMGGFFHHLLRYDYDRVRAMTLGIAAFNNGAAAMAAWSAREHNWLIEETRRHGVMAAEESDNKSYLSQWVVPVRLRGARRSLTMIGRLLADLFWPGQSQEPVCFTPGVAWRPDYAERPRWVVEISADGANREVFRHSVQATWRALAQGLVTTAGMILQFRQKSDLLRFVMRSSD